MITMKSNILLVLGALFSIQLIAQEQINQDVKVVKAYTPTISDAYKINQMPSIDDTTSGIDPQFHYRIISSSVATDYKPTPISPAKINTRRKEYLQKSYVKGGVGNYSSILAELGYNILENEKYVLGLNVGHVTSLGDITLEDDNTVDAPFHDTWAAADFKHFFDNKTLAVNMGFIHNKYQYYGYQTLSADGSYLLPDGSLGSGLNFMPDKDQRLSSFEANISLSNNETNKRKTAYKGFAGFKTFGNYTGVNQFGFNIGGHLYRPVNDMAFEADIKIESFKTSVPDTLGPMYWFKDRSLTQLHFNPSVNFNFDRATLKVGMLLAGVIDTDNDNFYLAPDIIGELTVVEGIATIYGGVTGRVNINDYQSMLYENPYASADINVKSSFYGLNLIGGIKGNFSATTSFSAGVEYSFFNDEHFWVNKQYYTPSSETEVEANYSNLFDVVYDDGSLLKVQGELMYRPKKTMEFILNGAYYGWNLDDLDKAWHKPELELGIEGRFSVLENLYATAGLKVLGERYAYDASATNNEKKLKGIVDLNVSAEYYFSKQWSFWASLNNMAASKYYKFNGYPMQGFNAKAGIIFSF